MLCQLGPVGTAVSDPLVAPIKKPKAPKKAKPMVPPLLKNRQTNRVTDRYSNKSFINKSAASTARIAYFCCLVAVHSFAHTSAGFHMDQDTGQQGYRLRSQQQDVINNVRRPTRGPTAGTTIGATGTTIGTTGTADGTTHTVINNKVGRLADNASSAATEGDTDTDRIEKEQLLVCSSQKARKAAARASYMEAMSLSGGSPAERPEALRSTSASQSVRTTIDRGSDQIEKDDLQAAMAASLRQQSSLVDLDELDDEDIWKRSSIPWLKIPR